MPGTLPGTLPGYLLQVHVGSPYVAHGYVPVQQGGPPAMEGLPATLLDSSMTRLVVGSVLTRPVYDSTRLIHFQ